MIINMILRGIKDLKFEVLFKLESYIYDFLSPETLVRIMPAPEPYIPVVDDGEYLVVN